MSEGGDGIIDSGENVPFRRPRTCSTSDISGRMPMDSGGVELLDTGQEDCRDSELEMYNAGGRDNANIVVTSGGDVGRASGDDPFDLPAGSVRSEGEMVTVALALRSTILACHMATFASHCFPNTAISACAQGQIFGGKKARIWNVTWYCLARNI